jgi:hypothetical protein
LIRLPGLFNDFWLDEIWTWEIARGLGSPLDIFFIRDSNSHPLNTWILYCIGDTAPWSFYRVHSLLAGVGGIWLTWLIAAERGRLEAVIAALLGTASYLLIHYSSEARGYTMVIFFALASYLSLRRYAKRPSWRHAAVFWALATLGLLAHLIYLHAFIAFVAASALDLRNRRLDLRAAVLERLRLFSLPTVFLLWFYVVNVNQLKLGGGLEYGSAEIVLKALSYAGGGPAVGAAAIAVAGFFASFSLASIAWLWRTGMDDWLFYFVVIYVSPLLMIGSLRTDVFFTRYFLLNVAFALIPMAFLLADLWRRGGRARAFAAGLLCLYVTGNAVNTARFLDGVRARSLSRSAAPYQRGFRWNPRCRQ